MNFDIPSVSGQAPTPEQLAGVLGSYPRWRILKELAIGEPRNLVELTAASGCSYEATVKHMMYLRRAGVVVQGRNKVYQLPTRFLPTPGQRIVDFGYCVLRFDAGK